MLEARSTLSLARGTPDGAAIAAVPEITNVCAAAG